VMTFSSRLQVKSIVNQSSSKLHLRFRFSFVYLTLGLKTQSEYLFQIVKDLYFSDLNTYLHR